MGSFYGEQTFVCLFEDPGFKSWFRFLLKRLSLAQFKSTYMRDGHGATVQFDENGDAPGRYMIMNFRRNRRTREYEYHVVGTWNGELSVNQSEIVWAGETQDVPRSRCSDPCQEGQIKNMQKGEQCCWICTRCNPWEYIQNEKTCESCEAGFWPYPNKTGCFALEVQYMTWSSIYAVIPMVLATVGIFCTMFVICLFIMFNSTPVVMASGRELSYMLLGGCVFCFFMTFMIVAPPSTIMCSIQRFGVGFGFSIIYSSLLIKTNRISRIFESARRSAKRPPFISPKSQIIMTCILILIQVLFTSVWLLLEPPGTRLVYPDSREPVVIRKCKSDDISFLVSLVYNMLLIIVCTVYAVKTRKIPENFNESKFIARPPTGLIFSWKTKEVFFGGKGEGGVCVELFPFSGHAAMTLTNEAIYNIRILSSSGQDAIQITTLCVSISLSASVALLCLFLPKVYIIVFQPQKNVRKLTMNSASYKMAPTASTATGNNHSAMSSEHLRLNVQPSRPAVAGATTETETDDRDSLASL
ncbi:hypothetical protein Btru_043617 [Bulinus truncatus]|nr:hypothetical protein Btru_043617 [Bulinus truncatus]